MRPRDLVLLHGQPGLGTDWLHVIAELPEQIRVLAPDRPGYGSSGRRGGGFAENAAALLEDLDARGIERAVVAGHSYGGGVALTLAAQAPERVEALILLASVGPGCLNGWDRLLAAPGIGPVTSLVAWHLTPWFARARLNLKAARLGTGRTGTEVMARQFPNWYVWGFARSDHAPLWRTFLAEQRAVMRDADDLALLAPSVHVPVLLLADPADTLVPIRTARELAGLLPAGRLSLIEGSGHHLPLRAPERVAEQLVAFLGSLDSVA